ncbi:MAG: LysM domain-containing protein [Brevinematales bacterium]
MAVDESKQRKKLEKLLREMSKKYAGYGSSSPTKDEIELLEWAARRDEMHSKVAPVMTGEQKAYFDERYIEWQSMEALERSVTNANETKQLSGVYEVKKGDTLWAISKATGISIKELLKLNKQLVGRENYIRPGEVINLSFDNMDMDEFNRSATQKEIERSRWIGEEWERREQRNRHFLENPNPLNNNEEWNLMKDLDPSFKIGASAGLFYGIGIEKGIIEKGEKMVEVIIKSRFKGLFIRAEANLVVN